MPLTTYTAGEVLTAASLNANLSFAASSPAGGLTLIKTQTIGSAVSSVAVTGAFSATYDYYKIIITGGSGSSSQSLELILGATVTGYYSGMVGATYAAAASSNSNDNNAASWQFMGHMNTNGIFANVDIGMPFLNKNTTMVSTHGRLVTTGQSLFSAGFLNNTTSYTGFTFTVGGATMTGGEIRVYGYANSQDYMTYKIQIDDLVRNATADEAAEIEARHAEAEAQIEAQTAKAVARQAVLDKLGLTADEAAALLGQFGFTCSAYGLRNNTR